MYFTGPLPVTLLRVHNMFECSLLEHLYMSYTCLMHLYTIRRYLDHQECVNILTGTDNSDLTWLETLNFKEPYTWQKYQSVILPSSALPLWYVSVGFFKSFSTLSLNNSSISSRSSRWPISAGVLLEFYSIVREIRLQLSPSVQIFHWFQHFSDTANDIGEFYVI